jgi:hypothetical protein
MEKKERMECNLKMYHFQVAKKGVRQDIEEADAEEAYYKWMEENPNAGKSEFKRKWSYA